MYSNGSPLPPAVSPDPDDRTVCYDITYDIGDRVETLPARFVRPRGGANGTLDGTLDGSGGGGGDDGGGGGGGGGGPPPKQRRMLNPYHTRGETPRYVRNHA